jgi:hypothetical protein
MKQSTRKFLRCDLMVIMIQIFFGSNEPVNIYTMENERAIARASASASASAKKSTRRKHASRARAKEETSNLT